MDEDDFEDKETVEHASAENEVNSTHNSGTATTARSDDDFLAFEAT